MTSEKQRGFVVYFDDVQALQRQIGKGQLDAGDAFAVLAALAGYAQTGEQPKDGALGPAASMAYEMMAGKVSRSLEAYAQKTRKSRAAAEQRWGAKTSDCRRMETGVPVQADADACERMQTHADACRAVQIVQADAEACECMQTHGNEMKRNEMNHPSDECAREDDADALAAAHVSQEMDAMEFQWRRMGNRISETDYDWMAALLAQYGTDDILAAMREADSHGAKRSRAYVERCLKNWKASGRRPKQARASPAAEVQGGKEVYEGYEML